MSCNIKSEYTILPKKSYEIIRKCGKCGCKTNYINTNNFRVNANGNALDVWLIYQCEKCKHTYNLTIYERVKPGSIDKNEYKKFLDNDSKLALAYGTKKELFLKNKATINTKKEVYDLVAQSSKSESDESDIQTSILIKNPYEFKIRADKILCEILKISRNEVKNMIKEGFVYSEETDKLDKTYIGKKIEIIISNKNNLLGK